MTMTPHLFYCSCLIYRQFTHKTGLACRHLSVDWGCWLIKTKCIETIEHPAPTEAPPEGQPAAEESAEWTWLFTAEEEGERSLLLVISRLVQMAGRESWRQVEEYRYPVEESITLDSRLKSLTAGIWDVRWWISGILSPSIACLIVRCLDGR